jgi:hypothetical protein
MVWGWSRPPLLLVPLGGIGDPARRSSLIDHEIAHLVRRDHLTGLLAHLLVCAFPWHPLAWWTRVRIARLSELACDDWVLSRGHPAPDYAESLLGVAGRHEPALVPAAAGRRSDLAARIRRILRSGPAAAEPGRGWWFATLFCLLGSAAAGFAQEGSPDPATRESDPSLPPGAFVIGRAETPEEHLAEIRAEIDRLREDGGGDRIGTWTARHETLSARLAGTRPLPPATERELHVVGVYEGVAAKEAGPHATGVADVRLTRRGAPVILALSSYEPVVWRITLDPGVELERVVVAGYYRQRVEGIGTIPVEITTWQDDRRTPFFTYRKDSAEYVRAHRALRGMTGIGVTTFQGRYTAPARGFEVGPGSRDFRAEVLDPSIRKLWRDVLAGTHARLGKRYGGLEFRAAEVRGTARLWTSFTTHGPTAGKAVPLPTGLRHFVPDAGGRRFFALSDHELFAFEAGETSARQVDLGPILEKLSWPHGLALDTKRNRLVVADGNTMDRLLARDLATGAWTQMVATGWHHFRALAYDGTKDVVYALSDRERQGTWLTAFAADGKVAKEVRLSRDLALGRKDDVQMATAGDHVVVLHRPCRRGPAALEARTGCVVVEPATGRVVYAVAHAPR